MPGENDTMSTSNQRLRRHKELISQIRPILGGNDPAVQSSVLAELLATWLGGWPAGLREDLLANHLKAVRELIEHVAINRM